MWKEDEGYTCCNPLKKLSYDKNEKGFELNISTVSGNPGTGKKKGQIAAFDLAYIQFADELGINCLHFILHDQIENVHDNQITSLLNEIVSNINCQYVLPVLRDKLPDDINIEEFQILSLSQEEKLFKIWTTGYNNVYKALGNKWLNWNLWV